MRSGSRRHMVLRSPDPQSPHHKSLLPDFLDPTPPPLVPVLLCKLPAFHHVALACRIHLSETNFFFRELSDVSLLYVCVIRRWSWKKTQVFEPVGSQSRERLIANLRWRMSDPFVCILKKPFVGPALAAEFDVREGVEGKAFKAANDERAISNSLSNTLLPGLLFHCTPAAKQLLLMINDLRTQMFSRTVETGIFPP